MSEIERRVGRAVRDHGAFEPRDGREYVSTTTPFDATLDVAPAGEGRISFTVRVRVPMLNEVADDHVAAVVEEGWLETFQLRVTDVGGVLQGDHELSPTVRQEETHVVVETSFEELDERRGVDDAGALVNFVEGTYAQGIIPGYEYTDPVGEMIEGARQGANGGRNG